jgi:hypothetical protein
LTDRYFTDREAGPRSRTIETIDDRVWGGLFSVISSRLNDESFGWRFPERCPDGGAAAGCDEAALRLRFCADISEVDWPLSAGEAPKTPVALDVLEFFAASVGRPIEGAFHSYFKHSHLTWDREVGLEKFVQDVNAIFVRNGIALELASDGLARRTLPGPIAETMSRLAFDTGDGETDKLMSSAARLFLSPKESHRRDAVEKLWDAFERIKTLEPGKDKRASAAVLLDRVAAPGSRLRANLEDEALALTKMGNTFRIRHSETSQEVLATRRELDYVFTRMFAFVVFLLESTGRVRG